MCVWLSFKAFSLSLLSSLRRWWSFWELKGLAVVYLSRDSLKQGHCKFLLHIRLFCLIKSFITSNIFLIFFDKIFLKTQPLRVERRWIQNISSMKPLIWLKRFSLISLERLLIRTCDVTSLVRLICDIVVRLMAAMWNIPQLTVLFKPWIKNVQDSVQF